MLDDALVKALVSEWVQWAAEERLHLPFEMLNHLDLHPSPLPHPLVSGHVWCASAEAAKATPAQFLLGHAKEN